MDDQSPAPDEIVAARPMSTMKQSAEHSRSLFLHSTWWGILSSHGGAMILAAFSVVLTLTDGLTWYTIALVLAAMALVAIVLFDVPIASEFTAEGVTRRCLCRHHFLSWSDVDRVRRMRVGTLRVRRSVRGGGLVAQRGRRSSPLVDTMENEQEFETLIAIMGDAAERVGLDELRPSDGRSPTWIYRRSRWRPESVTGR